MNQVYFLSYPYLSSHRWEETTSPYRFNVYGERHTGWILLFSFLVVWYILYIAYMVFYI